MHCRTFHVIVRSLSWRATTGRLTIGNLSFPCAVGRSGRKAHKREGDGATPDGCFAVLRVLYRADKVQRPRTGLPMLPLRRNDGWCDAVGDRNYNRPVRLPYPASAERMWREDDLYDLVVVLGCNSRPRVQGLGSAIFMHVARSDLMPTEGCVALRRAHLRQVLALMGRRSRLLIAH